MLFTLLVSLLAGAAVPFVQPRLTEIALGLVHPDHMPDEGGQKVAAFGLVMLGAAVLLILLGADPSAALLLLGGIVGYFHKEIRAAVARRGG